MDDLFDGYMVLDGIGDFLEDSTLANDPKAPDVVPQTIHHAQLSKQPLRPKQDNLSGSDQGTTISSADTAPPGGLRQRRGHTKSRLGCIPCKRRKIKCSETWPSCTNCNKRGLGCRYPDVFKHARRDYIESEVPSPRQLVKLSETPTIYSSEDMQLFHHYLISAHPWIPHDWEELWVKDIPAQCHRYPYLMDAMLALAGSHLAVQVENPKTALALQHRQRAIAGLEDSFAKWPPTADESYIMLATSYLLCFQSSYIGDGFLEHFLSLRGCSFLSQMIIGEGFRSPFSTQKGLSTISMDTTFRSCPEVDQELLQEALLSLKGFSGLMAGTDVYSIERAIVGKLAETLRYLLHSNVEFEHDELSTPGLSEGSTMSQTTSRSSSPIVLFPFVNPILPAELGVLFDELDWENITDPPPGAPYPIRSFIAIMAILTIFSTWPQEALIRIFDPTNQLGNIVMVHFCAIRFLLSSLSAPKNALTTPVRATIQWATRILAAIDDGVGDDWTKYVEWPRKILRCMEACTERNKGFTMEDVRSMLLQDPGALKEGRARRY